MGVGGVGKRRLGGVGGERLTEAVLPPSIHTAFYRLFTLISLFLSLFLDLFCFVLFL